MKFCSQCSHPVRYAIPDGEDRNRHICDACGVIHYQNPKIIAGCIPVWGDRVLLCKRAIAPRRGLWTLPAGFMELGETLGEAARREAWEEATIDLELEPLYVLFSLPKFSHVYAFFRARMVTEQFCPGQESLDVRLFAEHEVPWDQLAFETVERALRRFFSDRRQGVYPFREEVIHPSI